MTIFLINVFQEILADLASTGVIAVIIILFAFLKFSGIRHRVVNKLFPRRPDKRVIVVETIPSDFNCKINKPSFVLPIAEHERDILVKFYSFLNDSHPHNGRVVRLEKLYPNIEVSEVGFFDLLATNMTVYPSNIRIKGLYKQLIALFKWIWIYPLWHRVASKSMTNGYNFKDIDEIIKNKYMANVIAVSVLLVDKNGNIGLVRRKDGLAIESGSYAATSSGTLSVDDLNFANPFIHAAQRELKEEVGLEAELILDGIVFPLQKMQPVFIYSGRLTKTWKELLPDIQKSRDYDKEISKIITININNPSAIIKFLTENSLTDVTAYHLWLLAVKKNTMKLMINKWKYAWVFNLFSI